MPILKKDLSIAEFLLPHLIIAVICTGGGEEGINTVLLEVSHITSPYNWKKLAICSLIDQVP